MQDSPESVESVKSKIYASDTVQHDIHVDTLNTSSHLRHQIGNSGKPNVTCINCGYDGHTSKNCNFPITSYGIVCYYMFGSTVKFITIQRKDSLSYVDFVRGKYSLHDALYIQSLFENMTMFERKKLSTCSFYELWKDMWGVGHINTHMSHKRDYEKSYHMFTKLRKGYTFQYNNGSIETITLQNLLAQCKNKYVDTEWEFPKGRRVLYEEDVVCARREFYEETGISPGAMLWTHPKPFEEIYTGTNHMRYRNIYYLGQYVGDPRLIRKENLGRKQKEEVRDIQWMSIHDVLRVLRNIYVERKEMIQRIHNVLARVMLNSWAMDPNDQRMKSKTKSKNKIKIKRTFSSGSLTVPSVPCDYNYRSLIVANNHSHTHAHAHAHTHSQTHTHAHSHSFRTNQTVFLSTPPGFPYPFFLYPQTNSFYSNAFHPSVTNHQIVSLQQVPITLPIDGSSILSCTQSNTNI